ncbi:MAG: terminase small subunit [Nitrospira sp.]|nr:terminase small subunit [Nitrospira sp.]
MTLLRTFSKLQIAKIFGVNRSTIYNWEIQGCPVQEPGRYGRRAKMNFEAVLEWYLGREEVKGVSEEGLEILEQAILKRKAKYYG